MLELKREFRSQKQRPCRVSCRAVGWGERDALLCRPTPTLSPELLGTTAACVGCPDPSAVTLREALQGGQVQV